MNNFKKMLFVIGAELHQYDIYAMWHYKYLLLKGSFFLTKFLVLKHKIQLNVTTKKMGFL